MAVEVFGGYAGSDVVKDAGLPGSLAAAAQQYHKLSMFDGGVYFNYIGIQPYGHITAGKMNVTGSFTPQPKVNGRNKDGLGYVAGVAYGQGPWAVGAGFYGLEGEGSAAATGNYMAHGFNVGGTYNLTKGVDFDIEFIQSTQHQNGRNFIDATGPVTQGNKITGSALGVTMIVGW